MMDLPDLPDLGALEQYARATAAILDVLKKLRHALPGRKKGDKRALDKEVDALQADLQQLIDLLTQHLASNTKVWGAVVNLLGPMDAPEGKRNVDKWIELINQLGLVTRATVALNKAVPDHERRLLALEHPPEVRRKRVPQKRRRRK